MFQRLSYLCSIVIFILNEKIYFITSNEIRRDNYDEKSIDEAYDSKIKMQQRRNSKDNQIDDQSSLIYTKEYNDMNDRYKNKYLDETYSLNSSKRFRDKESQKKDQTTLSSNFTKRNEYSNQNKYHDEEAYYSKLVSRRYSDIDYQRNEQSDRYNDRKFKTARHYDDSNQFERNNNNKDRNRYDNAEVSHRSYKHDDDDIRHKQLHYSDSIERSENYIDKGGYRYYREDHPSQNLRRYY